MITETYIEERLEEAARTLRRLPEERVTGYFNAWPTIKRDPVELLNMEKLPARLGPPPMEDITLMEEVLFVWLKWLEPEERRLVWLRAEKVRWKTICSRLGCDRTTAWRKYRLALSHLLGRVSK